ncbi:MULTISPECIES: hypothetical protein [Actinosynnema]|uniref:hypothetical protein n=1 Tax=Actinosynnema TaxID=40566 RepID=UPI0020A4E340|nr:hypothetical protein [Actinosynnema pretiosum]MCP2097367.1 hypothetical protein [Actinosynnema pretiosum]
MGLDSARVAGDLAYEAYLTWRIAHTCLHQRRWADAQACFVAAVALSGRDRWYLHEQAAGRALALRAQGQHV